MTKRKIKYWVIPPEADGEFVAHMEEVLETYEKAYDPAAPVLCMDEQPVQLLKETRQPIAATEDHPQRVDYEYEHAGTASIFHVCGTAIRFSPSDGSPSANEGRLGCRSGSLARHTIRRLRSGHISLR